MSLACRVVAVDVGSVRGKFAWAALDMPGREVAGSGSQPDGVAGAVAYGRERGLPIALGFEVNRPGSGGGSSL